MSAVQTQIRLKLLPKLLIGDKDIALGISCQIEGLTGSGTDHSLLRHFRYSLNKHLMIAGVVQIKMDLIGNDIKIMLQTDLTDLFQFLFRPDTANRIVGRTKHQHFGLFRLFFQICIINGIPSIFTDQGIFQQSPAVTPYGGGKGRINRCLNDNTLPGLCQGTYRDTHGSYHTTGLNCPFHIHIPVVAPFHPSGNGFIIALLFRRSIPETAHIHTAMHTFHNGGGQIQTHFRHREADNIGIGNALIRHKGMYTTTGIYSCKIKFHMYDTSLVS